MALTVGTGDLADSQQRNETQWVRDLVEGGPHQPGLGRRSGHLGRSALRGARQRRPDCRRRHPGELHRRPGLRRLHRGTVPQHYDPDSPAGIFSAWPSYPGLFDRAQEPFEAAGLDVPFYAVFGNHDGARPGQRRRQRRLRAVATGCVKPMAPVVADPDGLQAAFEGALNDIAGLDLAGLQSLLGSDPTKVGLVPPDPEAPVRLQDAVQGHLPRGDPGRRPRLRPDRPGRGDRLGRRRRLLRLEPEARLPLHLARHGLRGRRDRPLRRRQHRRPAVPVASGPSSTRPTAADELVVLFSHHAIPSLTADVPDELAGPCTAPDAHGHDINPGCDVDPRDSSADPPRARTWTRCSRSTRT